MKLRRFLKKGLITIGVIALIAGAGGGFYFLTSGGDPEKIRTAKKIITYALIGLLIVLLASALIFVIKLVLES
jgi:hypothetical protein